MIGFLNGHAKWKINANIYGIGYQRATYQRLSSSLAVYASTAVQVIILGLSITNLLLTFPKFVGVQIQ